ncbi:hypothetical protein [Bacillus sp. Marseille-Q1617]|uniref:hypothetical protein n=1 Tax=Bacillus sp. Marseille-Q1617 TaxID=2736887 RepID=UPI00158E4525|nr:hypothetical protein [Bacillus sp. Marseille-Q1617]
MYVHFCVEGHSEIFHKQEFEDITPLLKMKEAGTLLTFKDERKESCFIEGRIIKTSFETLLDSNKEVKEQTLVVHLYVENEDMRAVKGERK